MRELRDMVRSAAVLPQRWRCRRLGTSRPKCASLWPSWRRYANRPCPLHCEAHNQCACPCRCAERPCAWGLQAVLVVLSQGVSNFANDYMSYPTKLLFKASKLIVIMVVGRCLIGRSYHTLEVRGTTAHHSTLFGLAFLYIERRPPPPDQADLAPAGGLRSGWPRCCS